MNVQVTAVFRALSALAVSALLLFGPAGTMYWAAGWTYLAALALVTVLVSLIAKHDPELIKERLRAHQKANAVDRSFLIVLSGVLPIVMLILAGLDHRLHWTLPFFPVITQCASFFMFGGVLLTNWAMRSNPFFSSHIRIQKDRGQKVISSGPYRFVRHPGYTGAIFFNIGGSLVLGSVSAIACAVFMAALLVLRTKAEEPVLLKGLKGYASYTKKVRYRLLPFIW